MRAQRTASGDGAENRRKGIVWVRGHVLTLVLIGAVSGSLGLASYWSMRIPRAAMVAAAALVPDGQDVQDAMLRMGLNAESLAASGVVSADVAEIVSDARTYMNANHGSLLAADSDASNALKRVGRYTRDIQSGARDQATVDALATARSDLATAQSSQQTLLNGLFTAATASLTQGEKDILTILRSQSGWTIPTRYLCRSRTEAELLELRQSVAHKRIAENSGEDVDSAVQTYLTARDGETEVVTASTAMTTHLASVSSTLATQLDF